MAYTPYTETQLRERIQTLEDGLLLVIQGTTFADRGVTYRSADQVLKQISYFNGLLRTLLGRSKQSVGVATRGF